MNLKEQHIGIPTNDIVHFLPFWENGVKFLQLRDRIKRRLSSASTYKVRRLNSARKSICQSRCFLFSIFY